MLRTARELIFPLKHSSLNVLTRNIHCCPGEKLHVEKKDLKLTKNQFFRNRKLTAHRNSFLTMKTDNKCNKVCSAKNHVENRVWYCAHFIPFIVLVDIINHSILDKIFIFLWKFIFVWILWWEWLAKIFQLIVLEVHNHAERIEKLNRKNLSIRRVT